MQLNEKQQETQKPDIYHELFRRSSEAQEWIAAPATHTQGEETPKTSQQQEKTS